jgi:hypothetical protein
MAAGHRPLAHSRIFDQALDAFLCDTDTDTDPD